MIISRPPAAMLLPRPSAHCPAVLQSLIVLEVLLITTNKKPGMPGFLLFCLLVQCVVAGVISG
jgi:hypothetical protein